MSGDWSYCLRLELVWGRSAARSQMNDGGRFSLVTGHKWGLESSLESSESEDRWGLDSSLH